MRRAGIVGLGLIGTAIAHRLLAAGIAVAGIDLDPAKTRALAALGGTPADTVAGLRGNDAIILAVYDTTQVEQAVAELLPASDQIAVSVSTCDPARIAALAGQVRRQGVILLEMPISGASSQVAAGEATGLVAGDPAAIAAVDAILAAICPRRFQLPRIGDGARAKLAINLILGLNRAALAEGLVFAQQLGLDPAAFLPIARESAAYSQIMDVKGAKMVAGDFTAQARIVQSAKDFALMHQTAAAAGQLLPLAAIYSALLDGCIAAGEGDCDNAAVIAEIRRRRTAGHPPALMPSNQPPPPPPGPAAVAPAPLAARR